jgi:DNA polymerase I-like protein with 3'-5' exonuclease and polymerase domains
MIHQKTLKIDYEQMIIQKQSIQAELRKLEKSIFSFSNYPFNIMSPYEVSQVLFQEMKLQSKGENFLQEVDSRHRIQNHRTFAPTNLKFLKEIDHPISELILKYQSLSKFFKHLAFH